MPLISNRLWAVMEAQSLLHVTVLLVAVAGSFAALPNGWKACPRSAKDYESCLMKEVKHAIGTLVNGDKKLGAIPLDPLRISKLHIPPSPGSVNIDLKFSNLDLSGIKNIQISKLKSDWINLDGEALVPELTAIGDYKIDGKVLVLPIKGAGKCNLTFHQLKLKVNIKYKTIEKSGKKYFQMDKMVLQLLPEKFNVHLTNLFNGDKALGDNMNVFLNENWQEILTELSPAISQGLSQALKQISNAILSKIPVNEIDVK